VAETGPTGDPHHLLTELGRSGKDLAAAERRARTFLSLHGVRDQTTRDLRLMLREQLAEPARRT
jgi:hypothetical protein